MAISSRRFTGRRIQRGDSKATYGTGAFLLMNTGAKSCPRKIDWSRLRRSRRRANLHMHRGVGVHRGAAVQWLRDELKLIRTAADS